MNVREFTIEWGLMNRMGSKSQSRFLKWLNEYSEYGYRSLLGSYMLPFRKRGFQTESVEFQRSFETAEDLHRCWRRWWFILIFLWETENGFQQGSNEFLGSPIGLYIIGYMKVIRGF